jgi:tetratricopeptide (TPR) repeat protein
MDRPERRPKRPVKPAPKAAATDAPEPEAPAGAVLPVDLTDGVDEALRKFAEEAKHLVNKGRYTKVRFKFRGKPLLPDLPVAAVVAAEAATFYWTGILKALVVNLVGKSVFDVEFINEADVHVAKGREHLLSGDLTEAAASLQHAVEMDRDHAAAHLHLGVVRKLQGKKRTAATLFRRAHALDPDGETGRDAERQLHALHAAARAARNH